MKKLILTAVAAVALSSANAFAADMMVRKAAPPPPPSPWDIAFGAGIASDYNFRGISQSDRKPSVNAYFEPRYNVTPDVQLYGGIGGYSIDFPNRPTAEIDLYGGIRPTFGKLSLDFGIWYYWYPGGQCFNSADVTCLPSLPVSGNIIKKDVSFIEFFGKANYALTDALGVGIAVYYDPNWLNTGADGTYVSGTAKYTFPATTFANGMGAYVSGELAYYSFGTTDTFYAFAPFVAGVPLPDYTTWNIGLGLTWKVFTLDLRYYDTDLSRGDCNVLTGDHTATFNAANVSAINPGGFGSKWCDASFVAKLSFDATLGALK